MIGTIFYIKTQKAIFGCKLRSRVLCYYTVKRDMIFKLSWSVILTKYVHIRNYFFPFFIIKLL